ncbi:PREDICTED: juvenile hormone esterase-like isoform X1 [Papilio xuthus]|uniref:Carboxylic ester hydrolase n=1 Tax=Papilio xuthus TaxID=66420 RepID=A0AAJ7E660_PAPXU|nr:PREDICTED: juvenile hormone esterase-like isoform X1 [Papilio xuthus]
MFLIAVLIYILLCLNVSASNEQRIIKTTSGPVRGRLQQYDDISYYSYEGIPYAENPTGSLRFRPPIPRRPWTNVFNATQIPPVCPQIPVKYTKNEMSEDCLRLNIFVPACRTDEILPVLVFVHGGAFHLISGNTDLIYGPGFLMERGIVFVTMNYRLGILGFMSLDIESASGNAGLKDILLALEWIKANIERFGGSSDNITIGGNSSGASILNYLLMIKQSSGLFHKAILFSGSALSYRVLAKHPVENALIMAKTVCPNEEDKESILKCLRQADVFDIVKSFELMRKGNTNPLRPYTPFLPNVEKEFVHAVLTKPPIEILQSHQLQNIPVLAGFNSNEGIYMASGTFRYPDRVLKILRKNIELTIPSNIEYPLGSEKSMALAKSIVKFYFGDEHFSNWTLSNAFDFISDTHYVYGVDLWINMHKERKDSNKVYYYYFDFDGALNWYKIYYNITFPGASHADDLGYVFITNVTKPKLETADRRSLEALDVMLTVITNFVEFG